MLPDQQHCYYPAFTPQGVSGLRRDGWALNPLLSVKVEIFAEVGWVLGNDLALYLAIVKLLLSLV